jgi:N-acetylneuraminate 9-O-acetyltransferase
MFLFQVLFRLNFLTVLLCLIMNRPYQFYYFVPLVSFWFLMLYVVFALPPHITAASTEHNPLHYFYLVVKLVGLFSVITILYMSEVNSPTKTDNINLTKPNFRCFLKKFS